MKNNSLVSIIVPIYGTEDYLPACIDSILGQSYTNIQIILVDDQSPDECPKICDDYAKKDPRILVIHQNNKGVSGARNTGLEHVDGDYVMFVDSDDALFTHSVEVLVRDAKEYGADIVSATDVATYKGGVEIVGDNDGKYSIFKNEEPLLLSLSGYHYMSSACVKLFKNEFIKEVRFEEGKNINEDGFFIFQCCVKKPLIVHHNVPVYKCNYREGSSSRQKFSDKFLSICYFCDKKREIIEELYPQYINQFYNNEVRTYLQLLDILCSAECNKYKDLQKKCVRTIRRLYKYHHPVNKHHKRLALWVILGLYPLYKLAVRIKYKM